MRKIGFCPAAEDRFLPLSGHWESADGVYVSYTSALVKTRGAIGQCVSFSKSLNHDLWLPRFGSDGRIDRFSKKVVFDPLIWDPETHSIGIDEGDEWAARGSISRPRLGLSINKLLGLKPDEDYKQWYNCEGTLALKSEIWGAWKPDPDVRGVRSQDEGEILWAQREWLDGALKACGKSLIYKVSFSKYKSSHSYDESSGVKAVYVGLKRSDQNYRFWFAKRASKLV